MSKKTHETSIKVEIKRIQTVTLFESFFIIIIYMALEYLYCIQVWLVEIMLQLDCCGSVVLVQ